MLIYICMGIIISLNIVIIINFIDKIVIGKSNINLFYRTQLDNFWTNCSHEYNFKFSTNLGMYNTGKGAGKVSVASLDLIVAPKNKN